MREKLKTAVKDKEGQEGRFKKLDQEWKASERVSQTTQSVD